MDLIKIISLLIILIILIRLKTHLAIAIFLVSITTIIIYSIPLKVTLHSFILVFTKPNSISLIFAVVLITYFGTILSIKGNFKRVFKNLAKLIPDLRYSIAIIPSLIGMIPMPGGALFSAPMVNEGGNLIKLKPYQKHLINFVFRHCWEFFLPLYPAILLINSFFNIPLTIIIRYQFIYTLIYLVTGYLFILLPLKKNVIEYNKNFNKKIKYSKKQKQTILLNLLKDFYPILLLIFILIIFKININLIVIPIIILVAITTKIKIIKMIEYFKKSFSFSIVSIIISILFFQSLLENSKILINLPSYMQSLGIKPIIIIGFSPFIVGLLTGITVGSIGITFPILTSFYLTSTTLNYTMIMFSYAMGFAGIMLSPMHLCLTLTKEYFKANLFNIYKKLLPLFIVLILIYLGLYFMNYPGIFNLF